MTSLSLARRSAAPLLAALMLLNGTAVSTLYWAQSVALSARSDFGATLFVSLMPSAALAGYAVGVAWLAVAVRNLTAANGIGLHALLLGLGASAAAVAPSGPTILAACFLIGIGCSLTQRALACATSAVAAPLRGPVIGCIVASGLVGIVIARAAIPAASASLGWRTLFLLDAALICSLGILAALAVQHRPRGGWEPAGASSPSAWHLWRREPVLRRAALQQALVFAAFNAGWALFARVLAQDGAAAALPMGIVASLGAAAALLSGWLCRRAPPARVAAAGLCAVLLAVALASLWGITGGATVPLMVVLDTGTQTALVANQAQAQSLATSAAMRGRLAAIVTTLGFAAGAVGAALGNAVY